MVEVSIVVTAKHAAVLLDELIFIQDLNVNFETLPAIVATDANLQEQLVTIIVTAAVSGAVGATTVGLVDYLAGLIRRAIERGVSVHELKADGETIELIAADVAELKSQIDALKERLQNKVE